MCWLFWWIFKLIASYRVEYRGRGTRKRKVIDAQAQLANLKSLKGVKMTRAWGHNRR
jgi:hypothetical protein